MILKCYVDDKTLEYLRRAVLATGRSLEDLAESAIANAATEYAAVERLTPVAGDALSRQERGGAE